MTTNIIERIAKELDRLGVADNGGIVVTADSAGGVRFADDGGSVCYADADRALEALVALPEGTEYNNVWHAIPETHANA